MYSNLQKRRPNNNIDSSPPLDSFTSVSLDNNDILIKKSLSTEEIKSVDPFLKPTYKEVTPEYSFINPKTINNKYLRYFFANQRFFILTLLTLCSMFTRYYKISLANKPIWDEVHFGKFGSYYLRGSFYHDVHPPLGKMLVAVGGKLSGYDGTFKFEGGDYPPNLNYFVMRVFHATFGVALVPLAYLTLEVLGFPFRMCFLAASLVLLDNGLTVISRFILLDSMLIVFIAMSVYFLAMFHSLQNQPFTNHWYFALVGTGISLGLASSVKWIGLFAVALVGLYTVEDLWNKLGDLKMSKGTYMKHWMTRVLGLILAPMLVYIICFRFHFLILNNSGPGDGTMDSLFQARLNRNNLLASPPEMVYLGNVTMRSGSLDGGLLHSHPHNYPSGSGQQQITCYGYKDNNNDWTILHEDNAKNVKPDSIKKIQEDSAIKSVEIKDKAENIQHEETQSPEENKDNLKEIVIPNPDKVHDGNIIKLRHVATGKFLRVQNLFDAIISGSRAYEVSGSEEDSQYSLWKVELVDDLILSKKPDVVQTLSSRFRLRNPKTGCLLASGDNKYPDWGYSQREVYCVKDISCTDEDTLWNIEGLSFEGLPPGEKRPIPVNFVKDFIRIHRAMWNTNNALVPDDDKFDHLTSHAWEWPLMRRGIRMCGWGDNEVKYYMLSNPIVVWGTSLSLLTYFILLIYYQLRMQRLIREWVRSDWEQFIFIGKLFAGGYLLQYMPFFLMGRVLYVHHYFPALYFACLFAPFMLEHVSTCLKLSNPQRNYVFVVIGSVVLLMYVYFAPMTFGMDFPSSEFASRGWLYTWRFTGPEVAF